jgi:hypothetical protein
MPPKASLSERFWSKVIVDPDRPDACWRWSAATTGFGYGILRTSRPNPRNAKAHRVSWELHFGEIPEGMMVLHRCDTPTCTNPRHLFLGRGADNVRDMVRKGRHWNQGLTTERAYVVKYLLRNTTLRAAAIAEMFRIGLTTLWMLNVGRAYRHVVLEGATYPLRPLRWERTAA